MDTLYLVFKHHSKLSLDCLTDGIISPQANEDFNSVTLLCQATRRKTLRFLLKVQKCRPATNLIRQLRLLYHSGLQRFHLQSCTVLPKPQFPTPHFKSLKPRVQYLLGQRSIFRKLMTHFCFRRLPKIMRQPMKFSDQCERKGQAIHDART